MLRSLQQARSSQWRSTLTTSATALLDQVVVSGLGFCTSIIIGRESQELLGLYYLVLSLMLFARGIQESLIAAPYKVYCHRYSESRLAEYAGSSLLHHSAISTLMFIVLLLLGLLPLENLLPSGIHPVLLVLAITLPVILLRELLRQFSFAALRFGQALIVDASVATIQIGGLIWLAQHDQLTISRALAVIAIACLGASLTWFWGKNQPLRFHRQNVHHDWALNWSFGRWALAGQIVGSLAPYIVPWILSWLQDTRSTGLFAACMTLVGASRVLTDAIFNYLTPKSAQAYHQGGLPALLQMLWRWGTAFTALMGLFTLMIFFFGEWILVTAYGPAYAETRWILTTLAAALWIHTIGFTCGDGLFVLEKTRENFWADLISTALTFIVSVPLIATMGVQGAALATLVALSSGAIARCLILQHCLRKLSLAEAN